MRWILFVLLLGIVGLTDGTYQGQPFGQEWSDAGLITQNDHWENVPGFIGYRGDNLVVSAGASPDTILAPGDATGPVSVLANQADPSTLSTGGIAEFAIADPVIALQGSGTADAPNLVLHLNTLGKGRVRVTYRCRDIDGSADNAVQPVALQYRTSPSGNFVNVPEAFVRDATRGPSLAGYDTVISVMLPTEADNRPELQVRWITANAVRSDEWVGIDDIAVTAEGVDGIAEEARQAGISISSYPNPCNPLTRIELKIQNSEFLILKLFDVRGREVATLVNEVRPAGVHVVDFDGRGLPSGVYFCRLEAGGARLVHKLLLLR